ncbi:MAG: DEAD/DEAH box helicase [Deltaproteobacteria bacterium]|nr:DEAD/DEAH box helicase [Deltaproteobacteria bacterium]
MPRAPWNPAVEDEAPDRAHLIGQRHPVTVYRIVAAGTIEEVSLELNGRKRELRVCWRGGDAPVRLTAEELLELVRSGAGAGRGQRLE